MPFSCLKMDEGCGGASTGMTSRFGFAEVLVLHLLVGDWSDAGCVQDLQGYSLGFCLLLCSALGLWRDSKGSYCWLGCLPAWGVWLMV